MAPKKQGLLHKALAAADAQNPHPIVSAAQFAHLTRTTGGATMNAHTNAFTTIGSSGYGVGGMRADKPLASYGETNRKGMPYRSKSSSARIPTRSVGGLGKASPSDEGTDVNLGDVLAQKSRIRRMTTSNPQANVGSWSTSDGRVDVDASEVERDLPTAMAKGTRRHEAAIFDFKTGNDIDLPTPRKR